MKDMLNDYVFYGCDGMFDFELCDGKFIVISLDFKFKLLCGVVIFWVCCDYFGLLCLMFLYFLIFVFVCDSVWWYFLIDFGNVYDYGLEWCVWKEKFLFS